eukprot:gb/GECG01010227.1/.p1 GENE.gb/GECG01010227.1/~~gb/GECG01010227.1/.p1  ORF type:complete len:287 (+),score=35.35 gb/GECG01010227.1/:1-861(+)
MSHDATTSQPGATAPPPPEDHNENGFQNTERFQPYRDTGGAEAPSTEGTNEPDEEQQQLNPDGSPVYFEPPWIRKLPAGLYEYLHPSKCCCDCFTLKASAWILLILRVLSGLMNILSGLGGGHKGHVGFGISLNTTSSHGTGTAGSSTQQEVPFSQGVQVFFSILAVLKGAAVLAAAIYIIAGLRNVAPTTGHVTGSAFEKMRRGVSIMIGYSLFSVALQVLVAAAMLITGILPIVGVFATLISAAIVVLIGLHFDGVILSYCVSTWMACMSPQAPAQSQNNAASL